MAALTEPVDNNAAPANGSPREHRSDDTVAVLIVDDHEHFRVAVRALLETDLRLTVVGEAADGRQAVDAAIELSPDVVLMDLEMPGMGGLEAIAELARQTGGPQVIVLTGSNDRQAIEQAQTAGAARYLLKSHIADICGLTVAVGRREPGTSSTGWVG